MLISAPLIFEQLAWPVVRASVLFLVLLSGGSHPGLPHRSVHDRLALGGVHGQLGGV